MKPITADDVPYLEARLRLLLAQFESGEMPVCDLGNALEQFLHDLVKREGELWDARATGAERAKMEAFLRRQR